MTEEMLVETRWALRRGALERFRGHTYGEFLIDDKGKNLAESRTQVKLYTRFSRNVPLKQFVVPANMLDITESQMMITSALLGSIGLMHRFCPIDFQFGEVDKAKRAHNFRILDPIRIRAQATVLEAKNMMKAKKTGSLLVHDNHNRLVGLVTERDVEFASGDSLVKDRGVMTPFSKLVTARVEDVKSIEQAIKILHKAKVKKLPIVDNNRHIRGLITRKDTRRLIEYPLANLDKNGNLVVGATIGAVGDFIERAQELKKARVDVLVMDVTSAHSVNVEKAVAELRRRVGDIELVVGNISNSEQANFLIELGVQGIKVGVGPGGPCTTRRATGVGVPQLFAVLETCWNLIFKYGKKLEQIPPICADGGIRCGADATHALFGGADTVMVGTMLAGTPETPGETYPKEDGFYKRYRGMASIEALIARYKSEGVEDPVAEAVKKSPEGVPLEVKVRGSAETIIKELTAGVQSGISRRGVLSLREFKEQNPFDPESGLGLISEAAREESKFK